MVRPRLRQKGANRKKWRQWIAIGIFTHMGKAGTKRRELLATNAIDPVTGQLMVVIYSHAKLLNCLRGNAGQIQEAAHLVPMVLRKPQAVFRGLRRDADEPVKNNEEGWLCYSGIPTHAYNEDGTPRRLWPKEVFLVFVSADKVVYNWYWYESDPGDPDLPKGYKERFRERLI